MPVESWPGTAYPLGATFDGNGTNFALFSEGAERVELCLFDSAGNETRVDLVDDRTHPRANRGRRELGPQDLGDVGAQRERRG